MSLFPLVTVTMCTYNGEKYLDSQIQSIIDQDYANIEIIIVDDCSSDSTWEKLKEWKQKFINKIYIYSNEVNLGFNKNFEKAMSLARGEYIAIADQDDIWLPHKISKLVRCFEDKDVLLAHGAEGTIYHDTIKIGSDSRIDKKLFKGSDIRTILLHNQVPGHCVLFSKSLLRKVLPIPEQMFYDWWVLTLATCYGKVAVVDDLLMYHRMHDTNAYFKIGERYKEDHGEMVLQSLYKFLEIKDLNTDSKRFIEKLIKILERHFKKYKGKFDLLLFINLLRWRKSIFDIFNRKSYIRKQAAIYKAVYIYSKW